MDPVPDPQHLGGEHVTCYEHPSREASATCRRCERPICWECMVQAPVGWQCRRCVHGFAKKAPETRYRPRGNAAFGRQFTPVTSVLIAANVVCYLASGALSNGGSPSNSVLDRFANVPLYVYDNHEYYRLITSAFLHLNPLHILLNMVSLYFLGPTVELALGRVRYGALYLVTAVGGSVFSYLLSPDLIESAGASGAIFGVAGAYFVLARRNRLDTSWIVTLLVINLVLGFVESNVIDWRDHIGGLVTGGLLAFGFFEADRAGRRRGRVINVVTVAVVLVVLAVLVQLPPGHVNWS